MRIEDSGTKLELAKVLLVRVLDKPKTVQEVYAYCKSKCPELSKQEIKEARKELGVESKARFGIQYWSLQEVNHERASC